MHASATWINDYLDPPAPPEVQADALTRAGFPVESFEEVQTGAGTDIRHEVELTSNRGDCLCHLGLAREIAAMSRGTRRVREPAVSLPDGGRERPEDLVRLSNDDPAHCPLYTARLVRGVRIGPSPAWLRDRLTARGDIPRNNVVDATNFVMFESGQPTHVFDLAKLRGPEIRVRRARADEPFLPLGEGAQEIRLTPDDLVIADAERAVALAGVKGGALTAVTGSTTDILIEAAAFAPGAVRAASRRHGIATDSSYRFERGVHPGQIDASAERLCRIILDVAGGTLVPGSLRAGAAIPAPRTVALRPQRCRAVLGIDVPDAFMHDAFERLGLAPRRDAEGRIVCTIPPARLDLEREIDLIEEVGRLRGYEDIVVLDTISIGVNPPQPSELARRAVSELLVGMGFQETVTHTLVSEAHARAFLFPGDDAIRVDDERAGGEPILRPSLLPSLLRVIRHNLDHGQRDVMVFESAATFAQAVRARGEDTHREQRVLALAATTEDPAVGLRLLRGVVDRLMVLLRGPAACLAAAEITADDAPPWLAAGLTLRLQATDADPIGTLGVLAPAVRRLFDLPGAVAVAELAVPSLYPVWPPDLAARPLPAFPAIERDVSAIVADDCRWAAIEDAVRHLAPARCESIEFVTVYRGKGIAPGQKSLTLRLRFRAADRTLTHDEVGHEMDRVLTMLVDRFGAEIRR
ncbi:MAG: phenylalanine--tRNA ligase subunit beta [Phycisphaeraceae bacterium]|nr:phenylalanine--tRNA ligase subunit beta [Phycisphaeraceae bacterium]